MGVVGFFLGMFPENIFEMAHSILPLNSEVQQICRKGPKAWYFSALSFDPSETMLCSNPEMDPFDHFAMLLVSWDQNFQNCH